MLTVVIALVCFAVAFVSGGVLSKAFFATRNRDGSIGRTKLHDLLQAQRIRYRKRIVALNNVIRRHEETRDQIRDKLANIEATQKERGKLLTDVRSKLEREQQQNRDLQQQLTERDRCITEFNTDESSTLAAEKELSVLRIERDELAARIKRMEAEQTNKTSATKSSEDEGEIARMRAEMGELRETLATRDRRVHDLELQFQDSTQRTRELQAKLDNWKHRVTPLTRKLKQQKEMIRRFCEDDSPEPQTDDESGDDLKAIHGIGPALERRLQQHGIRYYRQIAELTADELADMAKKLAIAPNLAERDSWVEQARDLQEQAELCQTT